jgi:hypothetical protein
MLNTQFSPWPVFGPDERDAVSVVEKFEERFNHRVHREH